MKITLAGERLQGVFQLFQAIAGEVHDNLVKTVGLKGTAEALILRAQGLHAMVEARLTNDSEWIAGWKDGEEATVNFSKILSMAKSLQQEIEINVKDGWAFCKSGPTRFRVPGQTEFKVQGIPEGRVILKNVEAEWLRNALHAASLTTAKLDHGHLGLRSIHMSTKGETLTIESADGNRITRSVAVCSSEENVDLTLPQGAMSGLQQMLTHCDSISISVEGTKVIFRSDKLAIQIITAVMNFPNLDPLFPELKIKLPFHRAGLIGVFKRAQEFADGVFIKFDIKGIHGTVSSQSVDGEFIEEISLYEGATNQDDYSCFIDSRSLISCFSEMKSEVIEMTFADSDRLIVKPTGEAHDFTYVTSLGVPQ